MTEAKNVKSYAGKWGYTTDEELYYGRFESAEEAAEDGATEKGESVIVGQYRDPIQPEDCIDAECLLDQVWCHEDYSGEWAEGKVSPSREQKRELTRAVSRVMAKWLEKHNLRPNFGIVDETTVQRITVA